ncbi:MAG: hypothetical protein IT287_02780, partial [Bdellovibrionaceae bacterium]|nr:hypothetical protein [Pseudobdellovibrionaceae bacterium]
PYWQKLTNVSIYASLDGAGKRGEYLRKGIVWTNIEKNIQTLKAEAPHIRFKITPTISAYNIDHWPDFHKEWIENGWIHPNDIHTNYLTNPDFMSAQILPKDYKNQVAQKYLNHIEYLKKLPHSDHAQTQFATVLHFLKAQDYQNKISDFLQETAKLDGLRQENLFEVFPELQCLCPDSTATQAPAESSLQVL